MRYKHRGCPSGEGCFKRSLYIHFQEGDVSKTWKKVGYYYTGCQVVVFDDDIFCFPDNVGDGYKNKLRRFVYGVEAGRE